MSLWHSLRMMPKYEKIFDGYIPAGGTFTPAVAGLFSSTWGYSAEYPLYVQYWNESEGFWRTVYTAPFNPTLNLVRSGTGLSVGDGANLRFYQPTYANYVSVMRVYW